MHLISLRYDNEWSTWRQTSDVIPFKEENLELLSGEEITSISGFSYNSGGDTRSLQAETSAGRSWGPHGNHKHFDGYSLRSSPANRNALRLHHISGNKTPGKWILRWLRQYNQRKTKTFICFSTEGCKKNMIPDQRQSLVKVPL